MEKPTTERTRSVIPCFSSAYLKEDRQRHSEEHSLAPRSGKQQHLATVMADKITFQHLPLQFREVCQNLTQIYKLGWKTQNWIGWCYYLLKSNSLQLKNWDRHQINEHIHCWCKQTNKKIQIIFFMRQRDCLARQPLLDGKAPDSAFTTRRTCYAGFKHSRW